MLQVPLSDDIQRIVSFKIQIKPSPCYLIFRLFNDAVVPRHISVPRHEEEGLSSFTLLSSFYFFYNHPFSYPFPFPLRSRFLPSSSSSCPVSPSTPSIPPPAPLSSRHLHFLPLSVPLLLLFLSVQCPDPHECFINDGNIRIRKEAAVTCSLRLNHGILRIAYNPNKIRTRYPLNINLERCRWTNLYTYMYTEEGNIEVSLVLTGYGGID
jgi:hypothetical protein